MGDNQEVIAVASIIPPQFRSIFSFSHFNVLQSMIVRQILHTNDNMVIAAPTGSGKTVLHELAILKLLASQTRDMTRQMKCVFVAPNKALCQQRFHDWNFSFGKFGLNVMELTGDIDLRNSLQVLAKANIIITTPEKWDSLTRSWRQNLHLFRNVNLLLIDEIHHLGDDRGATLESIIIRMQLLNQVEKSNHTTGGDEVDRIRLIALSATLPNLSDIGQWLGCKKEAIHYFDEGFRPVPLQIHTIAYPCNKSIFLFEKSLDEHVPDVIARYSRGKQSIVFCSSKKNTETLAAYLVNKRHISTNVIHDGAVTARINTIQDGGLRVVLHQGVGYHHAGLPPDDRIIVEQLFLSGHIHTLCATSTLAHGINLPAQLVIIKGTNCWRGGSLGYEMLPRSEVIQMAGRAGRPGFDTTGVAVIMTSSADKVHYEGMSLLAEIVESNLLTKFTEAICAEISQEVICCVEDALAWIKKTFFYIRMQKNPVHYGLTIDSLSSPEKIDNQLRTLCMSTLEQLACHSIVKFDSSQQLVTPLPSAHIMTKHSIQFSSMALISSLRSSCGLIMLLKVLSDCDELHKPIRRQDKKFLNEVVKKVRFSVKERVTTTALKTYALLQCAADRLSISDFFLRVEQSEIVEKAIRILYALTDICMENMRGQLLASVYLLQRALVSRMWENSSQIFWQCPFITEATKRKVNDIEFLCHVERPAVSITTIQNVVSCSVLEAKTIFSFIGICRRHCQAVATTYSEVDRMLTIEITPRFPEQLDGGHSSTGALVQDIDIAYTLISYDDLSGEMVCFRKIVPSVHQQTFTVSLPHHCDYANVHSLLICNVTGLDHCEFSQAKRLQIQAEIVESTNNRASNPAKSRRVASTSKDKYQILQTPTGAISPICHDFPPTVDPSISAVNTFCLDNYAAHHVDFAEMENKKKSGDIGTYNSRQCELHEIPVLELSSTISREVSSVCYELSPRDFQLMTDSERASKSKMKKIENTTVFDSTEEFQQIRGIFQQPCRIPNIPVRVVRQHQPGEPRQSIQSKLAGNHQNNFVNPLPATFTMTPPAFFAEPAQLLSQPQESFFQSTSRDLDAKCDNKLENPSENSLLKKYNFGIFQCHGPDAKALPTHNSRVKQGETLLPHVSSYQDRKRPYAHISNTLNLTGFADSGFF